MPNPAVELPQSNATCETLDVRESLTVGGLPVLPGGAVLTDNVTLKGDGTPGGELEIKAVKHDATLTGNGTVASTLKVEQNLAINSITVAGGFGSFNGSGILTVGGQLAAIPDGSSLGGDVYSKGTSETGALFPAAIGPGTVNNYAPANMNRLWSQVFLTVDAGGADCTGISGNNAAIITFYNQGPGVLVAKHRNGGSTPGNQFNCPGAVDLVIPPFYSFQIHKEQSGGVARNWIRAVGQPSGVLQGVGAPDVLGIVAPVGTLYQESGSSRVWSKYGTHAYNWTLYSASARDGWLYRDDAMVQQWLSLSHTGTGTEVITGEAGHPGVGIQSVTSTATPDRSRILHANSSPGNVFLGGGAAFYAEYMINTPTLQDGIDQWSDRRGFIDTAVSIEPTNGAYFECDLAVNGNGNWWGVTANGGVRTKTDLGVGPAAGVWQKLRLEANAAGTSVRFLVDDVFIIANAANISTTVALWTASQMVKTLGLVNARTVKYDYVEPSATFSR